MYLQTDVDIRRMLSKLTNGVYDKHSSKQNFLLYIIYSYTLQLHLDLVTQTPLVKSLLCKRRQLRRQGTGVEVDALADKSNRLVCDY